MSQSPLISIIIPTINEAENLPPLVEQIAQSLGQRPYEILIVDDNSTDDTATVCQKLAQQFPIRLLTRTEPDAGLSGAVLHGISHARGDTFVVMDADLQHPPQKIPELLAALDAGADFALGSRYTPGGSTGVKWGLSRRINSRIATLLARPFAGAITDPMSGFFALRRSTFKDAQRLTPLGYKIALELMCKSRIQSLREVPIHFAERTRGQSKLTLAQQFKYLEHLSRLYDFTFPRLSPMVKFLIVTAASWLVGLGAYLVLQQHTGLALAATLAYIFTILTTAVFHLRYVRTQRKFLVTKRPWIDFILISLGEWLASAVSAVWLDHNLRNMTLANMFLLTFSAATVVKYILRKELLQDIRGLRKELRREDVL
jgi:dolichol-phosphate mannosyltransferase